MSKIDINKLCNSMLLFYKEHTEAYSLLHYTTTHDITYEQLRTLAKDSEHLFTTLEKIKELCLLRLQDIGMRKGYNPATPIFLMKAVHGLIDKVDLNISGNVTHQHVQAINQAWSKRQEIAPGRVELLDKPPDDTDDENDVA